MEYEFKIDKTIMQAVSAFCNANNIEDVNQFIFQCFKQGFDIEKYGFLGKPFNDGEKHLKTDGEREKPVEIEVIKEIRVEVPVEVIKEIPVEVIKVVEKIVEVPVDKIIQVDKIVEITKEVPVDKIVEVIKEVPVEIIKEVEKIVEVQKVVTKVEYISNKKSENELGGIIAELEENIFHLNQELESKKKIFSTKTEEMENIFQNEMSKKDKSLDELRRNLDIALDKPPVEIIKEVEVLKEIPVEIIKEVEVIKEVFIENTNDNKLKMLQDTIQNLNTEIRDLKNKNKDLEKKLLEIPKQSGNIPARFHGNSNLNDDLYR